MRWFSILVLLCTPRKSCRLMECRILVMPSTWHERRVDNIFLTRVYNKRKQRTKVKDVIQDMQPIRNNVIQYIDFAVNHSQMIFFCRMSCHLLHGTNEGWTTFSYNKRKHRKQMKDVMHCSLQRRYNVNQCTDFVIFNAEVMVLCGISHFDRESGRVWRLVLRLGLEHCSYDTPHVRQERVDNIFLTVRLAPPTRTKRKKWKIFLMTSYKVEIMLLSVFVISPSEVLQLCRMWNFVSFIYYVAPLMDG